MTLGNRLKQYWRQRMARREVMLMAAIAAICLCLLAFVAIAEETGEAEHLPLEAKILRAMRTADDPGRIIGPAWIGEVVRDCSAMGGATITGLLTVMVAGCLANNGQKREAILVMVAVVGGVLLGAALKLLFQRPRPEVVPHLANVADSSFPSGHSLTSAVVYITLGVLLARSAGSWRQKLFFISAGLLLSGLVGVSRVMLGVHYPSDVLAGWTAGLGWALLCRVVVDVFWPRLGAAEAH